MRVPPLVRSLDQMLSRQPPWVIGLLCVAMLAVVGTVDYRVGPPIVLGPFFLIPIALAAWYSGRFFALFIALTSVTISELGRDFTLAILPNPRVLIWNAAMRVIVYFAFTLLVRIVRLYVRMGAFPEQA